MMKAIEVIWGARSLSGRMKTIMAVPKQDADMLLCGDMSDDEFFDAEQKLCVRLNKQFRTAGANIYQINAV